MTSMCEQGLDCDVLIAEVLQRPPIWDKRHRSYSNRRIIEKLWAQISSTMAVEESLLRRKWKYLRDQFAVELGKISPTFSCDAGDANLTSKWIYFKPLLFLKDVVKPRALTGSLRTDPGSQGDNDLSTSEAALSKEMEEIKDELFFHEDDFLFRDDEQESRSQASDTIPDDSMGGLLHNEEREDGMGLRANRQFLPNMTSRKRKSERADDYSANLLRIEHQKLRYLAAKKRRFDDDEDLCFFKSLLPHVKKIPEEKKLTFRNRIHEIVEEFVYLSPVVQVWPRTHQNSNSSSPRALVADHSDLVNCSEEAKQ